MRVYPATEAPYSDSEPAISRPPPPPLLMCAFTVLTVNSVLLRRLRSQVGERKTADARTRAGDKDREPRGGWLVLSLPTLSRELTTTESTGPKLPSRAPPPPFYFSPLSRHTHTHTHTIFERKTFFVIRRFVKWNQSAAWFLRHVIKNLNSTLDSISF